MRSVRAKLGMTLMETVVTLGVVAALAVVSAPTIESLLSSLSTRDEVQSVVAGAFASAKALAVKEQAYVGVRFQPDTKGRQYMIFVRHDESTELNFGLRALEDRKPMALPKDIVVMDQYVRMNHNNTDPGARDTDDELYLEQYLNATTWKPNEYIRDMMTFTVLFSPTGQLAAHQEVRVRNRDGEDDIGVPNPDSYDPVFNKWDSVDIDKIGMFYQDDYPAAGLGAEHSRQSFLIVDRNRFDNAMTEQARFDYLERLRREELVYLNAYTGMIMDTQK